ncbi:ArsR/SmtB family transcription factor [Kitasatospora sp. NPDC056651]|uniref:ArsR/SmtB family transcription factor n=1 Tax=Kitasatospora sp. NPDC056651 TaxID=3345892 RepID=UPI00367DAB02
MIRIRLGSRGLGGVRFAVSPVGSAKDLLRLVGNSPGTLTPAWRARVTEALARHRLGLLAVVGGGGPLGYAPDFIRPEPPASLTDIDTGLHQIATTPHERIRYELEEAVNGHAWDPGSGRPAPTRLLRALDRGEEHFAHRLADEMSRFWHTALESSWPAIRARLEADVAARASEIVRCGLGETLNGLAPNLEWRDGELVVHFRTESIHQLTLDADAVILTPSVFVDWALFCAGEPPGTPAPRTPLIVYPAAQVDCLPPARESSLIGATRQKLLAELGQPRTTTEVARRLYLSPATVSYHLQILHRAGLVSRARRSREVLYQRTGG